MTTTHKFTEEPPDGTILADGPVDEVWVRSDKNATQAGWGTAHWYSADSDEDPMEWSELAGGEWQRIYRQSEVDELLAAAVDNARLGGIGDAVDRIANKAEMVCAESMTYSRVRLLCDQAYDELAMGKEPTR